VQDAIFLSASLPDPERTPEFAATADSVAITSAISALLFVTLGRRPLIWGGHPAITPMVWAVAAAFDVDYGAWVKLYQSRHWKDRYPEDNARFENVTYVPAEHDQKASLLRMRKAMFAENGFAGAVFIGGMHGILDEYGLFRDAQPNASVIPVQSTGGAAATLPPIDVTLEDELNYVSFFHSRLNISPAERRYHRPEEQPGAIAARIGAPD